VEMVIDGSANFVNSVDGASVAAVLDLRVGDTLGDGDGTGVGKVKLGWREGKIDGVVSVGVAVGYEEGCGDGAGVGKRRSVLVGAGISEGEGDGSLVGNVTGFRVLMTGGGPTITGAKMGAVIGVITGATLVGNAVGGTAIGKGVGSMMIGPLPVGYGVGGGPVGKLVGGKNGTVGTTAPEESKTGTSTGTTITESEDVVGTLILLVISCLRI